MVIPIEHTKGEYWGGTQLSFTLFKWTSIFLGFFGTDHLLLRSPTTAAIKFIGNILTLGYFYFYDVIQVLTEDEVVLEKGLSMPFFGYMGIGQGIFTKPGATPAPKTSPKPYLFAIYCIAVLIGFGTDFLIAGDFTGAAAKLFSLFPLPVILLAPVIWTFTFIWYIYTIIRTYFYTKHVLSTDKTDKYRGISRFFPFTAVISPYYIPFKKFIPPGELLKECDRPLTFPWNMIASFWTVPKNAAIQVVQSATKPAEIIIKSGTDAVATGMEIVKTGAQVVGKSVTAAAELATKAPQIIHDSTELIDKIQAVQELPPGPAMPAMPAVPAMPALPKIGGAITSTQESILLVSFAAIVLGGFGLTLFRTLKNNDKSPDDRPPDARTVRKSIL